MSIIFGIRKPMGCPIHSRELEARATATARYALDGTFVRTDGPIGMGFQPFHTHVRSKLEAQPLKDCSGNLLVLDGRLDNWQHLRNILRIEDRDVSDSALILAAFRRWGEDCFSRLIGDWAIALWSHQLCTLYLARDHAGTRTLYFCSTREAVGFATYLETLLAGGEQYGLDKKYAARFLTHQPIGELTPYDGIRAVPPAHYLIISNDCLRARSHWNSISSVQTRYRQSSEYQDHFMELLSTSLSRRTSEGAPIIAHLSGGMDSTSLVCLSDHIRTTQSHDAELLDTLSYYDDTEPGWNEKPYFSLVEARRKKTGIHIATSAGERAFQVLDPAEGTYCFPGDDNGSLVQERIFEESTNGKGYRAVISGIGGDELLGGVPTPYPELADYMVTGHIARLLRQAMKWALASRRPAVELLVDTAKFAFGLYSGRRLDDYMEPPWITASLRRQRTGRDTQLQSDPRRFGRRPSAVSSGLAWWLVMETLPHRQPRVLSRLEYRYPYLDRDLVNYLFSLPREELLRPGERRSLMRAALADIVPQEILNRRRKAYLIRGPIASLQAAKAAILELFTDPLTAQWDLIDPAVFKRQVDCTTRRADPQWWASITNTISMELWLRASPSYTSSAVRIPATQDLLHTHWSKRDPCKSGCSLT